MYNFAYYILCVCVCVCVCVCDPGTQNQSYKSYFLYLIFYLICT